MPFIGNQPALSYTSFAKQDFTTSATTSYTLDNPVANANELALFINFVRQEPTTAYSASGTSLTLTSATSASDDMYCVYLGKAVQTVNPPNASVGLSQLSATGTKDATTFLRGDNTFAAAGSPSIDDNGNATAITIDSSENVGIGTSSPNFTLQLDSQRADATFDANNLDTWADFKIQGQTASGNARGIYFDFDSDTGNDKGAGIVGISGDATGGVGSLGFITTEGNSSAERMRIDSSGLLLVGRTTPIFDGQSSITSGSPGANAGLGTITLENSQNTTYKHTVGPNASGSFVIYRGTDYAGVYLGWGATSWTANSDERLKTNLQPITDAVNKIKSLRTVTGRYITDDENISRSFLIAQDVQKVLPEAVDEQNNEERTLGLAYTDVIPLIIASIKEQQTKIEEQQTKIQELEARITTLENA